MTICSRPGCQTTAGCICRRGLYTPVGVGGGSHRIPEDVVELAEATAELLHENGCISPVGRWYVTRMIAVAVMTDRLSRPVPRDPAEAGKEA